MQYHPRLLFITMGSTLFLCACFPTINTTATDTADTAPTLAVVTAVTTPAIDTTPDFVFSSNEAGTISYGGDCTSATVAAVNGNNTITLTALSAATHSNCTVTVTDSTGHASSPLAVPAFTIVKYKPVNDTGFTQCGDYAAPDTTHHNNVVCTTAGSTQTVAGAEAGNGDDPVPAGQDAVFGRDSNGATNSDADGWKGLSYTKLDTNGLALANQSGTWDDAGSEGAGTKWSCVKDNVTGLIWEIKTNNTVPDLRDKDWKYSWLNSDNSKNGGDAGGEDVGDNCFTTTRCDTEKYVADVNAATLCGASDWRLPTAEELLSLTVKDRTNVAVDATFIANTTYDWHWSSTPNIGSGYAWGVGFWYGSEYHATKSQQFYVQLVRGGN